MKKTLKLAAVLGLSLSALVVGGGWATTLSNGAEHEVALPGDSPIWNLLGNGMAQGEHLIGHADGAPAK
ncbi:MAG TPA: hypothetical protein VEG38_14870 [Acidimicrobiia bacterium]|nr:hypothetical protein [Acidimicrobiia bacterium]